jgi:hypothetical protein
MITAFSPDGSYAAMGRVEYPPPSTGGGEVEPRRPLDALVFDADTFESLARAPIDAQLVAWAP